MTEKARIQVDALRGVSETLLIPLVMRAQEARRRDAILADQAAVRLLERIDYDSSHFSGDWASQVGVAIRGRIIDDIVAEFRGRHPEAAVVNLGCGLCTRFDRMDDGLLDRWVEVDVPEVSAVWHSAFVGCDRRRFIAASAYGFEWVSDVLRIADGRPLIFVAEGLTMYFAEAENRTLLQTIARHFPGAEVVIEIFGSMLAGYSHLHPTARHFDVSFKWGLDRPEDLNGWGTGLAVASTAYLFDYYPFRWGQYSWFRYFPSLRRMAGIVRLAPTRAQTPCRPL